MGVSWVSKSILHQPATASLDAIALGAELRPFRDVILMHRICDDSRGLAVRNGYVMDLYGGSSMSMVQTQTSTTGTTKHSARGAENHHQFWSRVHPDLKPLVVQS